MGTQYMQHKQGFTIIETMLVLAITGVLIATLLVGVGGSVNGQRYKDSVATFRATVQNMYTETNSVTNVNPLNSKWSCGPSASPTESNAPDATVPGQSDCVILGQYLTVVNDTITTAAVVGDESSNVATTNDIDDLKSNYTLGIAQGSVETSTLEWGAAIAWAKSGVDAQSDGSTDNRSIAILVVKSPKSGTVYTFTSNIVPSVGSTTSANLMAMMLATNTVPGQHARYICIDPSPGSGALLTVPEKYSVYIGQAASDSSAIESRTDALNPVSAGGALESSCNK